MAMPGDNELTTLHQTSIRGIQRCFGWWRYGGREMERWDGEGWSCRPRHGDGSPTRCSSPATLNLPSELMSHTSCLPFSLFLSYLLFLHHPPPFSIPWFELSLSVCLSVLSHSVSFQLVHVSVSLWCISPSTSLLPQPFLISFFFFFHSFLVPFYYPTHSICQNQAREPWKCHTNKVKGSISVSRSDTFINDSSSEPYRCSITSAGARPWGARHVWCVSECVYAWFCVIASVGLAAASFTVELVGVDNSITGETDLESEWRRRREMTAWSSSDQHCLVMTPWCVHQRHTKQTLPPFIALYHLYLCSVVCRLTGSLYGLHWGAGCYLLVYVYVISSTFLSFSLAVFVFMPLF